MYIRRLLLRRRIRLYFSSPSHSLMMMRKYRNACEPSSTQQETTDLASPLRAAVCNGETIKLWSGEGKVIKVINATYGRSEESTICNGTHIHHIDHLCTTIDVVDVLRAKCENMTSCHLFALDELLGNPCPISGSYLQLTFQVVPSKINRTIVCHGQTAKLSCRAGETLQLKQALVKRSQTNFCPYSISDGITDLSKLLQNSCSGGSCDIVCDSSNKTEPRFCLEGNEYVDILYECNKDESINKV